MTTRQAPAPPGPSGRRQPLRRLPQRWRLALAALVATAVALSALAAYATLRPAGPDPVPLSEAVELVRADSVASATLDDAGNTVLLTRTREAGGGEVSATYPFAYGDTLTETLIEAGVETDTDAQSGPNPFLNVLLSLIPVAFVLGGIVWLLRSGALTGGVGRMTGHRGKAVGEVPTTRFSDVAGAEEALAELRELVELLQDGERFTRVGATAPRGALLVGPPGTGKTLLARAVAGEAGVPFFAVAGSDFVETFAGVGAKRVRDLFDRARQAGRAIIFIDEIDAVGRSRGTGPSNGSTDERESTLLSMLSEMDGFASSGVIVLAATNRADILDPALTRPGRLDRRIQVPLPDRRGRSAILEVHAAGRPLSGDVSFLGLARRTPGFSGAELAQLVNEACMEAGRRGHAVVDQHCFDHAVADVALGRARTSALVTDADRRITAWHEAGHTVAALLLPDADDPVQVTIVPRGPAGGATWMSGSDDVFLTRAAARARLVVALAGRAAEEILLDGEFTQGAHGDLATATTLAMSMTTEYGMTRLGLAHRSTQMLAAGGEVLAAVTEVVEELLRDAHREAELLLGTHRHVLQALATRLLEEETLSLPEIEDVCTRAMSAVGAPALPRHGTATTPERGQPADTPGRRAVHASESHQPG